jgi:hypothetical protein
MTNWLNLYVKCVGCQLGQHGRTEELAVCSPRAGGHPEALEGAWPDSDLRRASLAGYRAIGLSARTIALLRVKALLKGKLGKQRRRPVDSAAQDARDLQR